MSACTAWHGVGGISAGSLAMLWTAMREALGMHVSAVLLPAFAVSKQKRTQRIPF